MRLKLGATLTSGAPKDLGKAFVMGLKKLFFSFPQAISSCLNSGLRRLPAEDACGLGLGALDCSLVHKPGLVRVKPVSGFWGDKPGDR